jgi:polysaccharide export outer membrane protein
MFKKIGQKNISIVVLLFMGLSIIFANMPLSANTLPKNTIKIIDKGDNTKEAIMDVMEINGESYVQLKDFSHFYRIDIVFDKQTKGVKLKKNGKTIKISSDVNYFYSGKKKIKMNSPALLADGRMIVPISLFVGICTDLIGPEHVSWAALKKTFTAKNSSGVSFWEDQEDYKKEKPKGLIEQGDLLEISVWQRGSFEMDELTREREVMNDGTVSFPFLGKVLVEGMTCKDLGSMLQSKLKGYIQNPEVSVRIKGEEEEEEFQVQIFGEVRNPGLYEIKDKATLIEAINMAGGFTDSAKMKKVRVTRNVHHSPYETEIVDCKSIIVEGQRQYDIPIAENDIIYVPKSQGFFGFIGAGISEISPVLSAAALLVGVLVGAKGL